MMDLVVNGQFHNGTFRIDNMEESLEGMAFLAHPYAVARDHKAAKQIVEVVECIVPLLDLIKSWQDGIFANSGIVWEEQPPAVARAMTAIGREV